jgi:hypothetical protein
MTGWIKHRLPASALLLCTAVTAVAVQPATAPKAAMANTAPGASPQVRDKDEEFLVFLGDWTDDQGNWQDPFEYEDPAWAGTGGGQENEHE